MNIIPLALDHYQNIVSQDNQQHIGKFVDENAILELMRYPAFAGVCNSGVAVISGVYDLGSGRLGAWALMGAGAGKNMVAIHRGTQRFLDMQSARRIELTVLCDFEAGHRWAKMLGFTLEAERMKGYDPDGRDHALYARVC